MDFEYIILFEIGIHGRERGLKLVGKLQKQKYKNKKFSIKGRFSK